MCGIYASIAHSECQRPNEALAEQLRRRGPDHYSHLEDVYVVNDRHERRVALNLTSSVLALRGDSITRQPFLDHASGSMLCWNGEAWTVDGARIRGNDGQVVFQCLLEETTLCHDASAVVAGVRRVVNRIQGPFAFVFYHKPHAQIVFGRDSLGRRSLLYRREPDTLEISSVGESKSGVWVEADAGGLYSVSLSTTSYLPEKLAHECTESESPWPRVHLGNAGVSCTIQRCNTG